MKNLCGFSLKVSTPLKKVCKFEKLKGSEVICESEEFCSLKKEI